MQGLQQRFYNRTSWVRYLERFPKADGAGWGDDHVWNTDLGNPATSGQKAVGTLGARAICQTTIDNSRQWASCVIEQLDDLDKQIMLGLRIEDDGTGFYLRVFKGITQNDTDAIYFEFAKYTTPNTASSIWPASVAGQVSFPFRASFEIRSDIPNVSNQMRSYFNGDLVRSDIDLNVSIDGSKPALFIQDSGMVVDDFEFGTGPCPWVT